MDIRIRKTTYDTVVLSDENVNEVTIARLKKLVYPGDYLRTRDGVITLEQDDPNHRHGSISEELVRVATELDIAVFKVLASLKVKNGN